MTVLIGAIVETSLMLLYCNLFMNVNICTQNYFNAPDLEVTPHFTFLFHNFNINIGYYIKETKY